MKALKVPIHKNRRGTMERISGAYNGGSIFGNINLGSKMYGESAPLSKCMTYLICDCNKLEFWEVGDKLISI